jgi:hypothetical protein
LEVRDLEQLDIAVEIAAESKMNAPSQSIVLSCRI